MSDTKIPEKDVFISIEAFRCPLIAVRTIHELMSISYATRKIKYLQLPHKKVRGQMHVIICGMMGGGKSTLLYDIAEQTNSQVITGLTPATIKGTSDKNFMQLIPPLLWDARNSLLCYDELYFGTQHDSDWINSLLQVLENSSYAKKMGYKCMPTEIRDDDLYCRVTQENTIQIKTRFVFMATTMMTLWRKQKSIKKEALKTRCLVLPLYPTYEELDEALDGKTNFKLKQYNVPETPKVSQKMLNKIRELVKTKNISKQNYHRTINDLCRIYVVAGWKQHLFDAIIKVRTFKEEE